ncbi:unnamed protein product [Nezara viridula]|uniref:Uncharacterized protein n=1 Tax=Nezara viridula TaxID=85310 RepID=A0A9P0H1A8_NEZVI|nr:unnamed protein product [Nezara viridula]
MASRSCVERDKMSNRFLNRYGRIPPKLGAPFQPAATFPDIVAMGEIGAATKWFRMGNHFSAKVGRGVQNSK